jgi:hypothetical protein
MIETATSYKISFRPELNCIQITWVGPVHTNDFKLSSFRILELQKIHNSKGIIVDMRKMGIINMQDREWLNFEFLPDLLQTGIKYCAIIRSEQLLYRLAVENVVFRMNKRRLLVEYFDFPEAAFSWISEIDSNPPYQIKYSQQNDIIYVEWFGKTTSFQFREGNETLIEKIREHNCGRVINDIRKLELISMEDQQWIIQDYLPRSVDAGFKVVAFINPEEVFNKLSVLTVLHSFEDLPLKSGFFDTVEEAEGWVKSINN